MQPVLYTPMTSPFFPIYPIQSQLSHLLTLTWKKLLTSNCEDVPIRKKINQFNDLVFHWEPMLSEKSLPSIKMVPWHLVTILQGENHQYEQNLSSVQPWLLRNVESGSSQVMHSKQRQTTERHMFPQKKEKKKFICLSASLNPNSGTCMCYSLPLRHLCNVSWGTWIISDERRHTSRRASDRTICSWLMPTA